MSEFIGVDSVNHFCPDGEGPKGRGMYAQPKISPKLQPLEITKFTNRSPNCDRNPYISRRDRSPKLC